MTFAESTVVQVATSESPDRSTYSPYSMEQQLGNPEDFYQPASKPLIRQVTTAVVKHEGPISLELLTHRTVEHWGMRKISKKALNYVRSLIPSNEIRILSDKGVFLWPKELDPDTYKIFRVPNDEPESLRSAENLPIREVANAILSLLKNCISVPEKDLVRKAARIFGFRRTGPVVENRMRGGIGFLIKKGLAREEEALVILEER